jgi:tetratricopeptide (TPR) repeat protein
MAAGAPTSQSVWDHLPALSAIQSAFDQIVTSGQGRVVLLSGGPTDSRSGLARTLAVRLAGHPARPLVVAGGFTSDGEWRLWPLPGPARRVAPLQAGVDLAVKTLELGGLFGLPGAGAVAKLLGQLAQTSAAAWSLLSRYTERQQPLSGQTGPDMVREVLRAAAGRHDRGWRPMVCILDDLDRAPTAHDWWRGLVLRLAGELADLPLLLVTTLEGPPELSGHKMSEPTGLWVARRLIDAGVAAWVPVGRLDLDAVSAWLAPCQPDLAERLSEVTGGDPGWLGELWEHWRATGTVQRDHAGTWGLAVGSSPGLGKVHDLLWERLVRCYGGWLDDDRLEQVVRMLAVGALEGQQFLPQFTAQAVALAVGWDADELIDELDQHLLAGPDRPDGLLEEVGFAYLTDPQATRNEGERGDWAVYRYRFVSELHWRTLRRYGLVGRERQDGCRALAAALQEVWQVEPERAAAEIATLLRQAGDLEAAASWHAMAEFGARVPVVEASARRLLAQDTSGWDRFAHAQAARQLEYAATLLWEYRPVGLVLEVAQGWARAAQAAGWQTEYARALRRCGGLHERREEPDAAIECYRQARRVAVTVGDLGYAARVMADRARVELMQGRLGLARRRAQTARRLASRERALEAEAVAWQVLTDVARGIGDWEGARAAAEAGAAAAEAVGDHFAFVVLLRSLSTAQLFLGQAGQARETDEWALEVALHNGIRYAEGWIAYDLGGLWVAEDPEVAEEYLLRALAIARQLDEFELEVVANVGLADLAQKQGDLRSAHAALGRATRLSSSLDIPIVARDIWVGWALLAEAQNMPGGQVALLWALAALHQERTGNANTAHMWEQAERAAAAANAPHGRQALAARAQAALAKDGGLGLLTDLFGPLHTNDQAGEDV